MKYTIEKGNHYSNFTINRLFPFVGKTVKGSVKFSEECLQQGQQSGWNKLTGISSLDIHKNSGRLVWMSNGNAIRIAGYVYKDGERRDQGICTIPSGKWFSYSIKYSHKSWIFSINGNRIIMSGDMGILKLRAYPYFGGQSTAPTKMTIWV